MRIMKYDNKRSKNAQLILFMWKLKQVESELIREAKDVLGLYLKTYLIVLHTIRGNYISRFTWFNTSKARL